jgi:hypothetical protein
MFSSPVLAGYRGLIHDVECSRVTSTFLAILELELFIFFLEVLDDIISFLVDIIEGAAN